MVEPVVDDMLFDQESVADDRSLNEKNDDVLSGWKKKYENDDWAVMRPFADLSQPSVRLVYFLPNDRPVQSTKAVELIEMILDSRKFLAAELERHGFGRKTFALETDSGGAPIVHFIQGRHGTDHYYHGPSTITVWEEFFEYVDDLRHLYFIIPDLGKLMSNGNVCGSGRVTRALPGHVRGTPHHLGESVLLRELQDTTGESGAGGIAILSPDRQCFLGATSHELGHAFGLGHDLRKWSRGRSVMSTGGTNFFLSFCAAEWLSASVFFNRGPFPDDSLGEIELLSPPVVTRNGVRFSLRVTDADGLHQVQILIPENYHKRRNLWRSEMLLTCERVDGFAKEIVFTDTTLVRKSVDTKLTVQVIDVNGNIRWAIFPVKW